MALLVVMVLVELVATGVPGVRVGKANVVTGRLNEIVAATVTVSVGVWVDDAAWAAGVNGHTINDKPIAISIIAGNNFTLLNFFMFLNYKILYLV